jgi:large repetitive protein
MNTGRSLWRGRSTRVLARLAVVATVVAMVFGAGSPADAAPRAGWPPLSFPKTLSHVVDLLRSPHWGPLPKQASGTAAGHSHTASAASTRAGRGNGHKPGQGKGQLPAYSRKAPTFKPGLSAPAKVGFNAKTSKRVASKSTAASTYYRNADGTYTKRYSAGLMNYRDRSGNYQPIDTSLAKSSDGRWSERANSLKVGFAGYADDSDLAVFGPDATHAVSLGLEGAAHVQGTASGNTVMYGGVLPSTDMQMVSTTIGLRQSLILADAGAASTWTYDLSLTGLSARLLADGSVSLVDGFGKTKVIIPAGYAYDSKTDPRSGTPASTHAVTYQLKHSPLGVQLVVALDPAWLHDPARVFPVTVDPDEVADAIGYTTYAESGAGNGGDHSMDDTMMIGSTDSGTTKAVSYVQFPGLGLDKSQAAVAGANLYLNVMRAPTCTGERFDVAPVTSAWTPSSVTSYPGPSYGASIGNLTPTLVNACNNPTDDHTKFDFLTVSLTTTVLNNWSNGTTADYGLAIYASTTDSLHWKKFLSAMDESDQGPILEINYTGTLIPQLLSQGPANGAVVTTLTPQLSALGTIDPGPIGSTSPPTMKYLFSVFDPAGSPVVNSGLVTSGGWNVPANKLRWGQTYYWQVQVTDGTNYSPNPQAFALTVAVPQPAVTSTLSQNSDNHGFDPQIGNYTTSATDADVATVGPDLSIVRDYNSRDPRSAGGFGAAWSSIVDMRAIEVLDSYSAVSSVVLTYPDGSQVGYGRNSDGTFTAGSGRAATLIKLADGYELIDKSLTVYRFEQSLGGGAYGIKSITDADVRAETFSWTSNEITTITSTVSGRALHLTWSKPTGAQYNHVASVATDPATPGQPATAETWTYFYSSDLLTSVCPPGASGPTAGCTQYGYNSTSTSQYRNQILDQDPQSFWPLSESTGTVAASAVIGNEGSDNGTYQNVTLGQPGPLSGGGATAAGFNGSSSLVHLPDLHMGTSTSQSISLWFNMPVGAPAGVLYGYSDGPIESTGNGDGSPALYVGTDGKLRGNFWYDWGGSWTDITSAASVADSHWHHVVLTGSLISQHMYLDGALVGSSAGRPAASFYPSTLSSRFNYIGTGYMSSGFTASPYPSTDVHFHATYFKGSVADVSWTPSVLSQSDITALYQAGTHTSNLLTSITRPSGNTDAAITYDPTTGLVSHLTDDNGGSWSINPTTVTGSSQVFRSAVMGVGAQAYYRLGDAAGSSQAPSEVNFPSGTYANVTLGVTGPFADESAASFNGTSSYVKLPDGIIAGALPQSLSLWFNTTHTNGTLFEYQKDLITSTTTTANYVPALYVGADGKLKGELWSTTQITSAQAVNDGKWHEVILTTNGSTTASMFLDGKHVGSGTGTFNSPQAYGMNNVYIGTGLAGGGWPDTSHSAASPAVPMYFNGTIAEVAYYTSAVTSAQASAEFIAAGDSTGIAPMTTVSFADPGGHTITDQYDTDNGNRQIAEIDGTGAKTTYGYDTAGFQRTVTDADGDVTTNGYDADGNLVSETTCQNQAANACSTQYMTYSPNTQGLDVAKGSTVTATSSSTSSGYTRANLVDGVTSTSDIAHGWSSAGYTTATQTVFVQADMGTAKTIDRVDLYCRNDPGNVGAGFPVAYTVQVSTDGSHYTTIATETNRPQPTTPAPVSYTFTPQSVRYVKVVATTLRKFGSSYSMQFAELAALNDRPDPTAGELLTSRDGRSASATDNTYLTSYTYDAKGELTSETTPPVPGFPSGRTTTQSYTDGTTVAAADTGFAPAGLPYRTTTPGGAVTAVVYDHNGDVASATNADGLVTQFGYDGLGRVVSKKVISDTYPSGLTTSYGYDGQDQVISETDPAVIDRVTGATHTAVTSTVYDPDGNITSQTVSDSTGGDASRTQSFHFNGFDETDSQTDADHNTITYTYDGYGNKTSETDPQGTITADTYDANGNLLTQVMTDYKGDPVDPQSPTALTESSRAYDPAGRLASITNAMGFKTLYTYTDDGLVATITRVDAAGNNPYVEQSNTYDAAGNILKQVTNNGATTTLRTVDAADRQSSTTEDPTGLNRTTSVSYTPDDLVATSTVTDGSGATQVTSATYSPGGEMTSRSLRVDGAGHPVGWWRLNQTSGVTAVDSSGTGNTAQVSPTGVSWSGGANPAAVFNGSGGYIATNGPVIDTSQSFTVSAWANLSSLAANSTLVSQNGAVENGFELHYATTLGWSFSRMSADSTSHTTANATTGTITAPTGVWTHVVGVFNAATGTVSVYVNGVNNPADNATMTTPWNATGPLQIGRRLNGGAYGEYLTGSVANVQVYNRALSGSEVAALYNAGQNGGTVASNQQLTTSWSLDQRGLPTAMTDPNGNVTNYSYDEAGKLAVSTEPAVNVETGGGTPTLTHPVVTTGYNTFGEAVENKDPNGNVTTTVYDADGRPVSQTLPAYTAPGTSTPIVATTVNTYDSIGNLTKVTDALNHDTSYVYDQLGDTAQITTPDGGVTHNTFDLNGDQLSTTDPTGAQTQATYDYLGRQITATMLDRYPTATVSTTTMSYAASAANPGGAWLASTTSQDGATTAYSYDHIGETTAVTDAANNTTQYQYDYLGRPVKTIAPDSTSTTATFDTVGNVVAAARLDSTGATISSTSATYDNNGNLLSDTDANNRTSTFTYDARGLLTSEVQPVSASSAITTSFGYDAAGNRTRFTDGRNNATIYTYNSWELPESTIEPPTSTYTSAADSTFTTAYDADGRPVSQLAPGGVSVSTDYDLVGNVHTQSGSGADAATATRTFDYDLDGRVTSATTLAAGPSPATSETFGYNDRGELLTATGSAGASSFSYDADGLMSSRTDAAGTTAYTYDGADRLKTLSDPTTGNTDTYSYNNLSLPSMISYGSGADTRVYTYDDAHRLSTDTLKTAGGAAVASITYGYDNNDNLTSKTTTGFAGSTANTYTYDYANRLTSWNNGTTTTTYGYDASGNRIQVGANVYTYDARDELTSDGVNSYTYTARGTLSSQSSPGGTTNATSDAFGQVITQGAQTYSYDALTRMLTATTSGGPTRTFSYTGADNTLASDGSNIYSRDPGNSLIGIATAGGGTTTGHIAYTDQHTDVVGDFTATGTALDGSSTYDPLGNVVTTSNQAGQLGFQSGWTDPGNGAVNMDTRWYNPATGQFTNRDTTSLNPAPNSASANPFAYINDNPLIGTDPTGQCSWWDVVCHAKSAAKAIVHIAAPILAFTWDFAIATFDFAVHTYHRATHCVHDLHACGKKIIKKAKRAAHHVARVVKKKAKAVVHAVKKGVTKAATYIKHHEAAIVSAVVSTAAFIGCDAVLGAITGGVGAVAGAAVCGAVAGAVGGLVTQGAKCIDGKKGACSADSFIKSAVIGGVVGGVAGLGGAIGGKILSTIGGKALETIGGIFTGGADDAADGVIADAATDVVDSTASSTTDESANTAAADADNAATSDAGPEGSNAEPSNDEPSAGNGDSSSPTCHSFTGNTAVLLANGTSKLIDQVKVGDKIKNSVPGQAGTQVNTVTRVIVTKTDHDFVDVTIAPRSHNKATAARPSARSSRARKALAGVAAAVVAAVGVTSVVTVSGATPASAALPSTSGTLTTTFHHPFYDQTQAAFVEADHLRVDDVLQTDSGTAVITGLRLYHTTQTTYDLTIGALHTYYVVTGGTPILVHNCDANLGTQVDHLDPDDDLVNAVHNRRLSEGDKSTKNYASARLKNGKIITGRAMGKGRAGIHAEEDLVNQAGGVDNIDAIYSERAPCAFKCDGLLRDTGIDVSYSFPWNDPDPDIQDGIRADTTTKLRDSVAELFSFR